MFEINLVPQIKRDALKTQKIRNLVIAACILIATICGVLLAIFGTTYGVQRAITTARTAQIKENYAKLQETGDLRYFLTIQNQLAELGDITDQKAVFSRVLGIVSDIVPKNPSNGAPTIQFSELNYISNGFLVSFDAQSTYGFEALHALEATMARLYYDYGAYKGPDGNEIEILREEIDTSGGPNNGIIYGVVDHDGNELRIYRNNEANAAGYYFDSQCLGSDGMTSKCKLIPDESIRRDEPPSYEINTGGLPTLRFKMSFNIDPGALKVQNRFVRVLGIPRQDVTDSFLQINNNWFVAEPITPEDQ
jgi:hypothetical protein